MTYTLKLNIKANKKNLKDVGKSIKEGMKEDMKDIDVSAPSSPLPKIAGAVGVIALILTSLKNVLKPILSMLEIMVNMIFMPIVSVMMSILRPFLLLGLRWLKKEQGAMTTGVEMVEDGLERIIENKEPFSMTKDFLAGFKELDPDRFGSWLITFLGTLLSPLVILIDTFRALFSKNLWTSVFDGVKGAFNSVKDFLLRFNLKDTFDNIKNTFGELGRVILDKLPSLEDVLGFLTKAIDWGTGKVQDGFNRVGNALNSIRDRFSNIWSIFLTRIENIRTRLSNSFSKITGGLSNIWTSLKSSWATIISGMSNIWSRLKNTWDDLINGLINVINKIPFVNIKSSKSYGGMIPETGLYHLHQGERVLTTSQAGSSSNVNITINGSVDDYNIDRIVGEITRQIRRRTGVW